MADIEVNFVHQCGNDLTTVNAARVSYGRRSDWGPFNFETNTHSLKDQDARLIHFLARNGHKSPFNHAFFTLHVYAPVFVARQLVKHKFMPWNEVSGRYVTFEPEFYEPKVFRWAAPDKKQGSGGPIEYDDGLRMVFAESHASCFDRYMEALSMGLCEEQARSLLPLDLMTQWWWSGTLGAWADMFNLRSTPDAQEETRLVAEEARNLIRPFVPVSWDALTATT